MSVLCFTSSAAVTAAAIAELEIELTIKEGECQRLRSRIKALKSEAPSTTTSLPTSTAVVPMLSFKNVLGEFPDILFLLLPYIADRMIFNSIASVNKDMHAKSKRTLPPWPLCYKLPYSDLWSWSPCGTRLAFRSADYIYITIIDQRLGPLRRWQPISDNVNDYITDLKFSPDGRYLVSACKHGFIRLWDNVTGNYEQLQVWNMREEVGNELINDFFLRLSVSTCSKYITVSRGNRAFLKDVESEGKTIKSLMPPFMGEKIITNTKFSSDGRAIFICCNGMFHLWRPYLDDDDEDSLITLRRQADLDRGFQTVTFSHDNSMVAIRNMLENEGSLWSIDTKHKCLTKKFDFQGSITTSKLQQQQCLNTRRRKKKRAEKGLFFTPDGKYIVANNKHGSPTLWSIAEGTYTNNTIHLLDNGTTTKHNFAVVENFSPNNRQCIVRDPGTGNHYITIYFVK